MQGDHKFKTNLGWGCGLVVGRLPSMGKAPDLIPSAGKRKGKRRGQLFVCIQIFAGSHYEHRAFICV